MCRNLKTLAVGANEPIPSVSKKLVDHPEEKLEEGWDAGRAALAAEPGHDQEDGERAESDEEPTARVQH